MKDIIRVQNLIYDYIKEEEIPAEETANGDKKKSSAEASVREVSVRAIDDVSFSIEKGSFTAIIGQNGSGKSTLAKNLNGLFLPTEGAIYVDKWDTADDEHIWEIRQIAGMVFQNPDNQLVASVVEDDVAFGPENLGIEPDEIRRAVDESLEVVSMSEFALKAPHNLSGGQKQRVAIAGVLAMNPECIIFDEPTAMLDPKGRQEVLEIIKKLHKEGKTIILITHFMEEASGADRVLVMTGGKVLLDAAPEEVFKNREIIRKAKLKVPMITELADLLRDKGIAVPDDIITADKLVEFVCQFR